MDLSVFSAISSGITNAFKAGNAILELKVDAEVALRINGLIAQLGDLSGKFLLAQSAHIASEERATALREEIARMNSFAAESQRYALNEMDSGAFCYTLKPERQDGEPLHHLCACCYGQQTKSILQFSGYDKALRKLSCPRCGSSILVRGESSDSVIVSRPRGSRSMFESY